MGRERKWQLGINKKLKSWVSIGKVIAEHIWEVIMKHLDGIINKTSSYLSTTIIVLKLCWLLQLYVISYTALYKKIPTLYTVLLILFGFLPVIKQNLTSVVLLPHIHMPTFSESLYSIVYYNWKLYFIKDSNAFKHLSGYSNGIFLRMMIYTYKLM